jgi:myo-inositol 2-dehydrogenase / D-chiro-inositol 1-dehydrogenase
VSTSSAPVSARSRDRIRVGVAGLGAVAQAVHLPLLARLADTFEIAAFCDLSPRLRETLGDRYRVPTGGRYETVDELLGDPRLDAVILLTSGSHGAPALAALDRDLPILCEKPLAYTLAEADRLAASPNADRLLLGYMKVFDPAVEEAARLSRDPSTGLGPRRAIEVSVLHPTGESQLRFARLLAPPDDIDSAVLAPLRAETARLVRAAIGDVDDDLAELYGGTLLGSVVHELSVIRAIAGDVVAIDWADAWAAPPGGSGSALAVGRLADDTRVQIGWHFLPEYPAYREDVRFHHVGGSVELTFAAPYRLNEPTRLAVSTGRDEVRRQIVFDAIDEAFERELLAFADLVRDGSRPRTGIADGRDDIVTCQRVIARLAERRGTRIGGEAAAFLEEPAWDRPGAAAAGAGAAAAGAGAAAAGAAAT